MLSFFKMYLPLWSECKQGVHADHFYKKNTKAISGHFQNETSGLFHNSDQNVSSSYFLKETLGFFHNFVYNVTTMNLSHPLRFLSKSIQKCNQNVSNHIPQWVLWEFMVKLSHIENTLWLLWIESAGYILIAFLDIFWKKSQQVTQIHSGYIVNKIVKETLGFFQKVATGYILITIKSQCIYWLYTPSPPVSWSFLRASTINVLISPWALAIKVVCLITTSSTCLTSRQTAARQAARLWMWSRREWWRPDPWVIWREWMASLQALLLKMLVKTVDMMMKSGEGSTSEGWGVNWANGKRLYPRTGYQSGSRWEHW